MSDPGFAAPPFAQPYGGPPVGYIYIMPAQPGWPEQHMYMFGAPPFFSAPAIPGVEGVWIEGWNPDVIQATPVEPFDVQPAPTEFEILTDEAI
jgi:hypothetical protein